MGTVTILLLIVAVFIALFLAGFQYIIKSKEKGQLKYWLSFFRFISVLSVFLLIINPSVKKQQIKIIKPTLFVAVDNSKSIKYNNQEDEVVTIVDKLKQNKVLNNKFNIQYYEFGNDVYPLDSLSFSENQTNLAQPLIELSKIDAYSPMVIVTDGNQNYGDAIPYLTLKNPIFPVIVGDTSRKEDLFIKTININKQTFISNKFPVEIFVNYDGEKPISKKLTITHNNKQVYSERLDFDNIKKEAIVSFFLPANKSGFQNYKAVIEPLKNERNTNNNTKNFSIDIIDERAEILLLTSIIHPDLGALKRAIESNKRFHITITKASDFNRELKNYNLFILYQPDGTFQKILPSILKNNNFLMVSGLSTDWKFLNNMQSKFSMKQTNASEKNSALLNLNYSNFIVNDIGFNSFPPLDNQFGNINFNIPYQTILFKKNEFIEYQQPMLSTFELNNQKGALLLGEHIWRWRLQSFLQHRSFILFDKFISDIVQYLSSNKKLNRLKVSVNTVNYANQPILFSASYLDNNYNFDSRANIWLTIFNKEKAINQKIPFSLAENRFEAEVINLKEGNYNYVVTVDNQDIKLSGSVNVLPFEAEQQISRSNYFELYSLSEKTLGKTYFANQINELINNLTSDKRFNNIQKAALKSTSLIDFKWLLFIIIAALGSEWFLRKYHGKI